MLAIPHSRHFSGTLEVTFIHADNQRVGDALNAVIDHLIHHASGNAAKQDTAVGRVALRIEPEGLHRAHLAQAVLDAPHHERVPGRALAARRKDDVKRLTPVRGAQIQCPENLRGKRCGGQQPNQR